MCGGGWGKKRGACAVKIKERERYKDRLRRMGARAHAIDSPG